MSAEDTRPLRSLDVRLDGEWTPTELGAPWARRRPLPGARTTAVVEWEAAHPDGARVRLCSLDGGHEAAERLSESVIAEMRAERVHEIPGCLVWAYADTAGWIAVSALRDVAAGERPLIWSSYLLQETALARLRELAAAFSGTRWRWSV